MTTPAKPWWMLVLEGQASDTELTSGQGPAPAFMDVMGLAGAGWEPDGVAKLQWHPPRNLRTHGGWVQGGFMGVALDMAQTLAVFSQLPEGAGPMTLEMKVSFVEAAFAEGYLVTGRVIRVGRTAAHTDGVVHDQEGKLIATSTSTHIVRPARRATS